MIHQDDILLDDVNQFLQKQDSYRFHNGAQRSFRVGPAHVAVTLHVASFSPKVVSNLSFQIGGISTGMSDTKGQSFDDLLKRCLRYSR